MPRGRHAQHRQLDPPEVMLGPWSDHTHSIIMLHGNYGDHEQFADLESLVIQEAKARRLEGTEGIKYIFPFSPINANGNTFWYDHLEGDDVPDMQCDNSVTDLAQWEEQVDRLDRIVRAEVKALGDASKVILGGSSAGGTLAIHVALMQSAPLGALICLRTVPMRLTLGPFPVMPLRGEPDGTGLPRGRQNMPIFVYQTKQDDTYVTELQERNYRLMECRGYTMTRKEKARGLHDSDDLGENRQAARWVVEAFFGGSGKLGRRRGLCLKTCLFRRSSRTTFEGLKL